MVKTSLNLHESLRLQFGILLLLFDFLQVLAISVFVSSDFVALIVLSPELGTSSYIRSSSCTSLHFWRGQNMMSFVKLDLAVACHSIWPSIYCCIISACDQQRINMAKKELTRKDFQEDFPTLRGFFLQTSRLTKEDLKARDELYVWYQENRMHWIEDGTRYTLEEHIATLAILHFRDFQNAKKICISFNGSVSCVKEACTFMHKCLFCGCKDPQRCSFRKKLVQERALFWERYNLDPFDPKMRGLGETDVTLQDTLRRLAKDPPKPKGKKTLETGSVGSMPSVASGHFGALQSDDEAPDDEEGNEAAGEGLRLVPHRQKHSHHDSVWRLYLPVVGATDKPISGGWEVV